MKIAAIDLDGTLLRTDCTISDYSKDIITKACKSGIMVVPTSGRSFRNIKEQIQDIEGIQYCISGNGSVVTELKTESVIYNHKIPEKIAYDIYREVREQGGFIEIYSDNDAYVEKEVGHILYETSLSEEFCESLLSTDIPILSANLLLKRGLMRVNKYHIAFSDPQVMNKFSKECEENQGLIVTHPTIYNMEVFASGCNKDMGIRVLCKKYGIDRKDIIAMGDSDNDVAMVQYAQLGCAVDNSMDILKNAADRIIGSNDEDGPAHMLEEMMQTM